MRLFFLLCISITSTLSFAQTSSRGPGKGPAVPGTGQSKYTYPQPPRPTAYSPTSIRPGYQVPEDQEKSTWRLTAKVDGRDPDKATSDVAVYSFANGKRVQVGYAKSGDELVMEEIRPVGKAIYYKFAWSGGKKDSGQDYWVSGSNVEYAGKK